MISTDVTGQSVFCFANLLTNRTIIAELIGKVDGLHVTSHGREVTSGFATDAANVRLSHALDSVLQSGLFQGPPACS